MRTLFALGLLLVVQALPASSAQSWSSAPSMGTARTGASGVVLDGRLYVMGGADASGTPLSTAEVFDPTTGWESIEDLNDARVDAAAAVLNGQIILMGGRGRSGEAINKVEVYDAQLDRWESFEDLDEEREGLGAVAFEGRLFAFGGADDDGGLLNTVEAYTSDWESYPEWVLAPPRARFGIVAFEEAVILAGGFSTFGPLTRVDRYLPEQASTVSLPPLSVARGGITLASALGVLFAIGGRDASDAVRADVEVLHPDAGSWIPIAPLPQAREGALSAVIGDDVYVVGGTDRFGSVLASVVSLSARAVDDEDGPNELRPSLRVVGANPARSQTAFEIGLPAPGSVRLRIVDVLGREVATLLDAVWPAGTERISWDLSHLPSGLYHVCLDAPSGRMIVPVTRAR
ncbi:MAG: hypothetical protein Rubg2KO_29420 [Rubricoccaceae bacterium]